MNVVDLSMHLDEGMPHHRLHSPLRLLPGPLSHWQSRKWMGRGTQYGDVSFANEQIVMGGHTGTHVDAPLHADPNGASVSGIQLEQLVGPARVIDVREGCSRRYTIPLDQVKAAASGMPLPEIVLLMTGWHELMKHDLQAYFDHSVGIAGDATRWLRHAGVRCIGIDAPSVDAPDAAGAPAHMEFLRQQPTIAIIENLVGLEHLPDEVPLFVCAPLPLEKSTGGPARCLAVL